jgi:hypothetical protein
MRSTRDFIAATLSDAALPVLRRPVEDVIYETLDRKQIPSRTDFKELRDLAHSLRGQLAGATGGVKKVAAQGDELDARVAELDARVDALEQRVLAVEAAADPARIVAAVLQALEAREPAPAPPDGGGRVRRRGAGQRTP